MGESSKLKTILDKDYPSLALTGPEAELAAFVKALSKSNVGINDEDSIDYYVKELCEKPAHSMQILTMGKYQVDVGTHWQHEYFNYQIEPVILVRVWGYSRKFYRMKEREELELVKEAERLAFSEEQTQSTSHLSKTIKTLN